MLVVKNKGWDIRAVTPKTLVRFAGAEWASYKAGADAQPQDVDALALAVLNRTGGVWMEPGIHLVGPSIIRVALGLVRSPGGSC
jgi:hypothetical protein